MSKMNESGVSSREPFRPSGQRILGDGLLAASTLDGTTGDRLISLGDGFLGKLLRGPTPDKRFSAMLLIPALIAFGISCYLSYATLTASDIAGCGGGGTFDCSHVINSKYSKWMAIPVSLLASGTYLVMLLALSTICFSKTDGLSRRLSWAAVSFCGIAAGLAAVWFVSVQAFIIEHFCPWCLAAHGCGLLIAVSIFIKRPFGIRQTLFCAGLASMGLGGLIAGQVMSEEPDKFKVETHDVIVTPKANTSVGGEEGEAAEDDDLFEAPMDASFEPQSSPADSGSMASLMASLVFQASTAVIVVAPQEETTQKETKQETAVDEVKAKQDERRTVTISGSVKLDVRQWPLIGSPDARYIFVEMFDYACPHCRHTHAAIQGACEAMGADLAVIVLPVPMNSNCNSTVTVTGAGFIDSCELSKLAVACWRCDPARFQEFHHWMFEGDIVPSYATAKQKVDELIGREQIDKELKKEAPGKYIAKHVQLYERAGKGAVPKLMFPATSIVGEFTSTDALVDFIRKEAK